MSFINPCSPSSFSVLGEAFEDGISKGATKYIVNLTYTLEDQAPGRVLYNTLKSQESNRKT